jgi:hypothetical protein
MKWSEPSLISLSANAQGQVAPCDVGSGYEAVGCETGGDYGQGCTPGSTFGVPGTPCSTVGNQATGTCGAGITPTVVSAF